MDVEDNEEENEKVKKGKKKQQKVSDRKEKEFERFVEDVAVTKDIRSKINLYVNKEEVDKLGKDLEKMGLCKEEEDDDSDTEIKMTELIDKLNIDDDSEGDNNGDDEEDYSAEFVGKKMNGDGNGNGSNKKVKIGEKRERNGEYVNDD